MTLVVQLLSSRYNLSADRQAFKTSQNYHNFGLVALGRLFFALCFALFAFGTQAQEDTEYREALHEMMELSGSHEAFNAVISQMIKLQKQQHPEVPEAFWEKLNQRMRGTAMDELVDKLVPVYQKHMSLEDIKAITAFYRTPAGQKLATKQPLIMQESMQIGKEWGGQIGQQIAEEIRNEGF